MTQTVPFRKMNGLGNEILVVDARRAPVRLEAEDVRMLAGRFAFDQLMSLEPSQTADVRSRIWNADGGEVAACGNGARCVASIILADAGKKEIAIETASGLLRAWRGETKDMIVLDMGVPRLGWREIPLTKPFEDTSRVSFDFGSGLRDPGCVNMGNPHAVFFVDDLGAYDLARIGPELEVHPLFPERANISLAQITGRDSILLKVWERGAGLTRACGTAACAVLVAAARRGLTDRRANVTLPGGALAIDWRESDGRILMTGPVETEFEGAFSLERR